MRIFTFYSLCLLVAIALGSFDGDSFRGKLEDPIDQKPCTRLFTNTFDIGCRTPNHGESVGALYEIRSMKDVDDLKKVSRDVAIVAESAWFNETLQSLPQHTSHIIGIIFYEDNEVTPVSTDVCSPQGKGTPQNSFTAYPDYNWNAQGTGHMYSSYRYCSENRKYGLYGNRVNVAEFSFYMGKSSITSKQCLEWEDSLGHRSPQCLPIGGQSVWSTAGPLDERDKVMIAVGIDSTAFFHDMAFGANDAAASIAVVLSAADVIGRSTPSSFQKQPLFFFANAEEVGYVGSRRFAADLKNFTCKHSVDGNATATGLPLCTDPIYPSTMFTNVQALVDIIGVDQVGRSGGSLFLQSVNQGSDAYQSTLAAMQFDDVVVSAATSGAMPPTPLTSFAAAFEELQNGMVLTGYDKQFNDGAYHTQCDTKVNAEDVITAALALARGVISLAGGDVDGIASVNATWTSDVLQCLLNDWECGLFDTYNSYEEAALSEYLDHHTELASSVSPPSYFTGVMYGTDGGQPVIQHGYGLYGRYPAQEEWNMDKDKCYVIPNRLQAFIKMALSYHLNTESADSEVCKSYKDCGVCTIGSYSNVRMDCVLGKCVPPNTFYHIALDPGIERQVDLNLFNVIDNSTPSFTEPYWRDIGVKIYPKAGYTVEVVTTVIGVTLAAVSVLWAYKVQTVWTTEKVL